MKTDLLDLTTLKQDELFSILDLATKVKENPDDYKEAMQRKTLLMIFDKASLRTRVSFETGMTQMGGHAIYYNVATSPLGKKETMADTAKTASRYVDLIMARISSHDDIIELAKNSSVPVINAMTHFTHPCQILADLQTIKEKKKTLKNLKLAYFGDSNNNVTHSLLFGGSLAGMDVAVGCPKEHAPKVEVVEKAKGLAKDNKILVTHNAKEAAKDADIIYTDSWMSYHIAKEEMQKRVEVFTPYQVNAELMKHAKPDAIFMNCLPAARGMEQTAEVIDGDQSVVFDQAENRLHAQKALMLRLLELA